MGYSKEKRAKNTKTFEKGNLISYFNQKLPVLYFVFRFSFLLFVFYLLWNSQFYIEYIHPQIVKINAAASSFILNLFGQAVSFRGDLVFSSNFSISVKRGCDAVEAMAMFSSALIAFPSPIKSKMPEILVGILILFLINLIRIISLFLVGLYYPDAFDILHIDIWQVLFIVLTLILWIVVVNRIRNKKQNAKS